MDEEAETQKAELEAELEAELTRLELYGNLEGMGVDEAAAAARGLETYIRNEKEGWEAVQEAAVARQTAMGRRIVSLFEQTGKKADENTLRAANKAYRGNVSFIKFGDFMENMDQLLTRMEAMPALKDFAKGMRRRLTEAFQAMSDAKIRRAAGVEEIYERYVTDEVLKGRKLGSLAGWMEWFKTSHETGIRLNGWITQTAKLTVEEVREIRGMTREERQAWIKARWESGREYYTAEVLDVMVESI